MVKEKAIEIVENFIDDVRLISTKDFTYIKPYEFRDGERYVKSEQYKAIQTLLDLVENSVPKEAIREKINELDKDIFYTKNKLQDRKIRYDYIRNARIRAFICKMKEFQNYLKELLEGQV